MSHTPGPWKAERITGLRQIIKTVGDGGSLAYMTARPFAWGPNFSHGQIEDNARLIAAAPKLLAMLTLARRRLAGDLICDAAVMVDQIDALIAEAEGK